MLVQQLSRVAANPEDALHLDGLNGDDGNWRHWGAHTRLSGALHAVAAPTTIRFLLPIARNTITRDDVAGLAVPAAWVSRAAALATIAAAGRAGMTALTALWRQRASAGTMTGLLARAAVALVLALSWPAAAAMLIGNRALLTGVLGRSAMLGRGGPVKPHVAWLASLAPGWLAVRPLGDLATRVVALPAERMRAALGAITPGRGLALLGRNLSSLAPPRAVTTAHGRARRITGRRLRRGPSAVGMASARLGGCLATRERGHVGRCRRRGLLGRGRGYVLRMRGCAAGHRAIRGARLGGSLRDGL